ncbi:ABC transporter permease [Lysobacter soli]|uniref:ABC transporter permease n=1 Tax=Lysobacter soli TaxID=453783 RepID=UPI00209D3833|nr:ABC transporter permease [Lysobacter soli]UTA54194.1 ABC transporter permease [Lysobacter soli]
MQKHADIQFLLRQLIGRELAVRYRTTMLGAFWLVLQPLLMLAVYTLVFSGIFKARWHGAATTTDFALMLFAGLIPFAFLSEVLATAPTTISAQPNFVKKVVFPLEILPVVKVAAAMVGALIGVGLLLTVQAIRGSGPSPWALTAPLVLLEMVPMLLGLGWMLSALGVYLRDIQQVVGIVTSILLFLSPIFFPPEAIPAELRVLIDFNPLVAPIQQLRNVTVMNSAPDFVSLLPHFLCSVAFSIVGYVFFRRVSKGFSDVL